MSDVNIRTRFAPSPTGFLHLGSARTALYSWLFSRHHDATFILRIEDTDRTRSTEQSARAIVEGMHWLGLDWDEGPFFQSERFELYQEAIKKLLEAGKIYRCTCTPEELDQKRKLALATKRKPKYDGTCRERTEIPREKPCVMRFRTPELGTTVVHDLIKGDVAIDNSELDDFVLTRSDGWPTYNFAVVVDDSEMKITHVIRGDDHLNNTPKQILLYEALGLPLPKFAHLPMILGQDRARLSKRHGATSIEAYRDMGVLSEAMINFLARLGWSHGDQEFFTKGELVKYFSLEEVGKSAAIFNFDKLLWLNLQHMKAKSDSELAELLSPFLKRRGFVPPNNQWIPTMLVALKERAKTLSEMVEGVSFAFKEPEYNPADVEKFLKPQVAELLEELADKLEKLEPYDLDNISKTFQAILTSHNLKMKELAQPTRVALTGSSVSPPIFETLALVPRERVIERLRKAAKMAKGETSRLEC